MLLRILHRVVAVALCVTVFFMGITPVRARGSSAARNVSPGAVAAGKPVEVSYRLRDAIPVAAFVAEPPDTTEEDDFFLPEETDNKKLIRDITVFVIVAAFVAFFIIKVFIEEDEEPPPDDNNGKPVPLPE